ncbi:DUF3631 domain-containing protein [Catellatospora vulcania]|uniref:DUF3631 domain-containing protein n=1 Tax=Catellatospora vulcania TaxID=1460450 RepID=UPI0038B275CF
MLPRTVFGAPSTTAPATITRDERTLKEGMLLRDIWLLFAEPGVFDKISTVDLLGHLHALPESPWGERQLTAHQLAKYLGSYGIESKDVRRPSKKTAKGYEKRQFHDAWKRHLAQERATGATGATSEVSTSKEGASTSSPGLKPKKARGRNSAAK